MIEAINAGVALGPVPPATATMPGEVWEVLLEAPPALSDKAIAAALTALHDAAKLDNTTRAQRHATAMRYWYGLPFGDEEDGRSQFVIRECQDKIRAMLPSIVRIFTGTAQPVVFRGRAPGDEAQAAQATDYVEHVVFAECDGFRQIHDCALEALRLGESWFEAWWDDRLDVATERYAGLLEIQLAAILGEDGVSPVRIARRPADAAERLALEGGEAGLAMLPGVPVYLYEATIRRHRRRGQPHFETVPAEEIHIDPRATSLATADYVARVQQTTVGELVARGLPIDDLLRQASDTAPQAAIDRERRRGEARNPAPAPGDPAGRRIRYVRAWLRLDVDGDGMRELYLCEAVGDAPKLLRMTATDHVALVPVAPYYTPFRVTGDSVTDQAADLQRASSAVFRAILDSLAGAIHPRTVVLEGQANLDEVMNVEVGAVIRERVSGAVRELAKPFVGPSALPVLETLQAIGEARTGITRASQGLTPDLMQSTTAMGISAQLSAAQDRLDLIVRTMADGVAGLYRLILELMARHQERARMVRLRGRWVEVDPRPWAQRFDVEVTVGIGQAAVAQKLAALDSIIATQRDAMERLGARNPLVSLGQLRAALAERAELVGIADPSRYYKPLPPDYELEQPEPAPPADLVLAQAELEKARSGAAHDSAKLDQDGYRALLEDDLARDQLRVKTYLEALRLQAERGVAVDLAALGRLLERDPVPDVPAPPGLPGLQPAEFPSLGPVPMPPAPAPAP